MKHKRENGQVVYIWVKNIYMIKDIKDKVQVDYQRLVSIIQRKPLNNQ